MAEPLNSSPVPANRLVRVLHWLEDAALVVLFVGMMLMAFSQIVSRNVFDTAIIWGDPLVRVLVLWVAAWGSMIAARNDEHIRIDVLLRFSPPGLRGVLERVMRLGTAIVSAVMAWASYEFVISEREFGGDAFAGIPVWICELVLPFAFALITLRYLRLAVFPPEQMPEQ